MKQEGLKQEATKKQPSQALKEEKKKPLLDDFTKKELAKIGMTLSMGTLVLTSFSLKSKLSKNAHIISGAALVGFSFWHNSLYTDKK
ncbi:MAG: hypothetical protein GX282_08290 [Campylobacteraceae bacterium]|nr:hypothetical protein [Campylobacteraceae bacterium]